jgi:hypothetical protein
MGSGLDQSGPGLLHRSENQSGMGQDNGGRNSIIGGGTGVLTLGSMAYFGHQASPNGLPLWTNGYWIWAVCASGVFMCVGIYEIFAPKAGWWMPPAENQRFWQITAYIVFVLLFGSPIAILMWQNAQLWLVWLPWILCGALVVVVLILLFRRRNSTTLATDKGSNRVANLSAPGDASKSPGFQGLETADRFPDFHPVIFEMQSQDPVVGDDMFAALIVEVLNRGHKSSCKAFAVTALTVYGATIKVEVFGNAFCLVVNGGRDCFNYLPEHYILNRAFPKAVERGESVTGVLPCVFRGIKNAKEIDVRTLKVEFADVIGDADGNIKWWSTPPVEGMQWEDPIAVKHRPTLPTLQQPCGAEPVESPNRVTTSNENIDFMARDYRQARDLTRRLSTFAEEIDSATPIAGTQTREWVEFFNGNQASFERLFRQDVVRLAANLRSRYGLLHAALADEILRDRVSTAEDINKLLSGLKEIEGHLAVMLADETAKQ